MLKDEVITKFYNKLFPDELDDLRHCKHLGHILDTRLNIPTKKILVMSNVRGINYEKNFI